MARKAFEMMMEGMEDAIAFAEGDQSRGRVAAPLDVKRIRAATNKSLAEFAASYRLPIGTVRDWEQNLHQPDAPAHVPLALIDAEPETMERLLSTDNDG